MKTLALVLLLAALEPASAPLLAGPNVRNGTVTHVPAAASLRAQVEGASDGWIGYALPLATPRSFICNRDYDEIDATVALTSSLALFYRVEKGRIEDLKASGPQCALEAAGWPVTWINAADARQGLEFLISVARRSPDSEVRKSALFWLSQQAGDKVTAVLREAADDPEAEIRARAVFAISQLPDDESIPNLIKLMTTHRLAAVRKKAAFWLGQKDDPRALKAIEQVLLH